MFGSENAPSADNQQERLITSGWVVGFVDGEGCFSTGFINQLNQPGNSRSLLGIQVLCEFAVTQGEKSVTALERLQSFFECGAIYRNHRHDNHRENLCRYVVRKREDLRTKIIPFFSEFELQTAKKGDFQSFVLCFNLVERGEHLTESGLKEIAAIASTMNRKKDRINTVLRILNDYTHSA
jgi:hypothetical protein